MKLAEALITRADLKRRIEQVQTRISANARYQEGEEPHEDALALVTEASEALDRLETIVVAINLTNASTRLADGRTMTAALARRETLRARFSLLSRSADSAQGTSGGYRQMRSELRQIAALPVTELRQQADDVARELRRLDIDIQRTNWEADLQG